MLAFSFLNIHMNKCVYFRQTSEFTTLISGVRSHSASSRARRLILRSQRSRGRDARFSRHSPLTAEVWQVMWRAQRPSFSRHRGSPTPAVKRGTLIGWCRRHIRAISPFETGDSHGLPVNERCCPTVGPVKEICQSCHCKPREQQDLKVAIERSTFCSHGSEGLCSRERWEWRRGSNRLPHWGSSLCPRRGFKRYWWHRITIDYQFISIRHSWSPF